MSAIGKYCVGLSIIVESVWLASEVKPLRSRRTFAGVARKGGCCENFLYSEPQMNCLSCLEVILSPSPVFPMILLFFFFSFFLSWA